MRSLLSHSVDNYDYEHQIPVKNYQNNVVIYSDITCNIILEVGMYVDQIVWSGSTVEYLHTRVQYGQLETMTMTMKFNLFRH